MKFQRDFGTPYIATRAGDTVYVAESREFGKPDWEVDLQRRCPNGKECRASR